MAGENRCHFKLYNLFALKFPLSSQRGQSSVFVLVMLTVVIVSAIFLYKSGRLTTEKIQLQNAADAAAYSASALEARSMNFAAYTNRAMAGNEVAIAQAVGLLSLADEWKAINDYFEVYADILDAAGAVLDIFGGAGAPLNTMAEVLRTIGEGYEGAGDGLNAIIQPIAGYWVKAFSVINTIYSYAQETYHLTTIALVSDSIFKNLEGNVVGTEYNGNLLQNLFDRSGDKAMISGMDYIALVGHFATYINGYTKRFTVGSKDEEGRLAATVREARDPFSSGDTAKNSDGVEENRDWRMALESEHITHFTINLLVKKIRIKIGYSFAFGIYSKGGSEVIQKDDKQFAWSAIDTSDLEVQLAIYPFFDFHPGIPTGGGASQAASSETILNEADISSDVNNAVLPGYGGAPDYSISWDEAKIVIPEKQIEGANYSGLKAYRDVKPKQDSNQDSGFFPFKSPFFLIGVVKDLDAMNENEPKAAGDDFSLSHGTQHKNLIATVAKSEVYFKRPTDLSYFAREDGNQENSNLFSPFWQARLVQPSEFDRFITIALQQGKLWISEKAKKDIDKIPFINVEKMSTTIENYLQRFL